MGGVHVYGWYWFQLWRNIKKKHNLSKCENFEKKSKEKLKTETNSVVLIKFIFMYYNCDCDNVIRIINKVCWDIEIVHYNWSTNL